MSPKGGLAFQRRDEPEAGSRGHRRMIVKPRSRSACRPWTKFGSSLPAADRRPAFRRPAAEAYAFVAEALQRFDYSPHDKGDPPLPDKVTGLSARRSRACCTSTGPQERHRRPPPPPAPLPTPLHQGRHRAARRSRCAGTLSGPATRKLCVRALQLFRPPLRARRRHLQRTPLQPAPRSTSYQRRSAGRSRADPCPVTSPSASGAGPSPSDNSCGSIRSTKRDLDGIKGLYHLNLVDGSPSSRRRRTAVADVRVHKNAQVPIQVCAPTRSASRTRPGRRRTPCFVRVKRQIEDGRA